MSMTPDTPIRPGAGRILAIALLGPLVGTTIIVLVSFIIEPPPENLLGGGEMVILLAAFGYLFGILPSSLAAFLYARTAPRLTTIWRRLVGCIFIGFFCGALGVLAPVWIMARDFVFEPSFMLLSGIAGAIALPLTALPFARGA